MLDRKVLIVEDDSSLQEIYSAVLNGAGIETIVAGTGEKGIELALKHHPSVIMMDVMLPDISGHEAVKKIRLDSWGKKATVIFLTNRDDAESIFKAVEQGSDEYIIKSHTSNQELLNKVRSSMIS